MLPLLPFYAIRITTRQTIKTCYSKFMNMQKSHIHFVGIGGIGMSGIATILKQNGYTVSGCDPDIKQNTIAQLKKLGCSVYEGNNSSACNDITIDTLVYIPMYATTIPAGTAEI